MKNEKRKITRLYAIGKQHAALLPFFSLLFSLFSFISCPEPLSHNAIPPGMGSFCLNVTDARTIMPSTLTLNTFPIYKVDFKVSGTVVTSGDITPTNNIVYLVPGTYDVEVTAYSDAGKTKPAASGTATGVEINEGTSNSVTVALTVIGTTGTGTFSWEITFDGLTLTTATMAVGEITASGFVPLEDEDDNPIIIDLNDDPDGSIDLPSGYHQVKFTLIKTGTEHPLTYYESLHIYQNLTSYYEKTFTNADFDTIKYLVAIEANNGSAVTYTTAEHGKPFNEPAEPTRTGYSFDGWCLDSLLQNEATFPITNVNDDIYLFAKWMIPVTNITLTSPTTISVNETVELTADITPINATNQSIVWTTSSDGASIAGNELTAATTGTKTITATIYNGAATGNYTQNFTITVNAATAVSGVSLAPIAVRMGETITITPNVRPAGATNKAVTWNSSNPDVATIDTDGEITAHSIGTTVITVTTVDGGFTASRNVDVYSVTTTGSSPNETAQITSDLTNDGLLGVLMNIDADILDLSGITVDMSTNYLTSSYPWSARLKKIILPDNLAALHQYFFIYNTDLEELEISADNPNFATVDGVLFNKSRTQLIRYPPKRGANTYNTYTDAVNYIVPNTVTECRPSAFRRTEHLKTVTLQRNTYLQRECFEYSSVEEIIGSTYINSWTMYTFQYSQLKNITLSLTSGFGRAHFRGCPQLEWVVLQASTPPSITDWWTGRPPDFQNCTSLTAVYVPDTSVAAYRNHTYMTSDGETGWKYVNEFRRPAITDIIQPVSSKP